MRKLVFLLIILTHSLSFAADTKVTALSENTTPASTDIVYIVDDPGGSPASEKITLANLIGDVSYFTSFTIPNAADVSGNTSEGMISWDSDDDKLYMGNGAGVTEVGSGGGGGSIIQDTDNDTYVDTEQGADDDTVRLAAAGDETFTLAADLITVAFTEAADHIEVNQTSAAGTENQALIFINDDRTGATANENIEASLQIDAEGTYAIYVQDGRSYFATQIDSYEDVNINKLILVIDDRQLVLGNGSDIRQEWQTNGGSDDLFQWRWAIDTSESGAMVFSDGLDFVGSSTFDDYLSPAIAFCNTEGADANDFAYVTVGSRKNASDVSATHYFDIYAGTGASDAAVDATTTEIGGVICIGDDNTATTGHSLSSGDTLIADDLEVDGNVFMDGLKSGADQGAAGAAAGELYIDTDDNSIKIGV